MVSITQSLALEGSGRGSATQETKLRRGNEPLERRKRYSLAVGHRARKNPADTTTLVVYPNISLIQLAV
jgi:hypothetical protein